MAIRTVGVVGTGNMGLPMAASLLRAGFEVLARDVDGAAAAAAAGAGARVVDDARALAAGSDMILVVVVDARQIESALFTEPAPASAGWRPGTPVALCSTIGPDDATRLAARIAAAGACPIDAPISGGPARAASGELSLMLAGDDADLARAEPVLAALGHRRFRISARPGDGARMKLVNNLLAGIQLAAGAEALAIGEAAGLDPGVMLDVVAASSGQSWVVEDRLRRAFAGDYAPRAHTRILHKDLALALEMARGEGFEMAIGAQARQLFDETLDRGLGGEDDAAVLEAARARRRVGDPDAR
ncbi:MAG: NAD(P)-dependent oxidoreductase [Ectothiorhodospiraceae bacterium]|nr:NAD(P)-dependent oxidoreductase [Ectothiorhodospiraceae bacterium]